MAAFLIWLFIVVFLLIPNSVFAANTSSLNFDGTNDTVSIPDTNSLQVNNTLTLMAWIRPTSLPAGANTRFGIYSTRVNGNVTGSWQMEIGNGSGASSGLSRLAVTSPGIWNTESPNYSIAVGTWQHVAYTKTGSAGTQKLYINGLEQSLIANNLVTFIDNTNNHAIGDAAFSARYFPGQIDDVRLYNKALTKDQIVQAMHDTYNDGVVAHWKFDDNTGCSTTDSSGNNNTGTLSPTCSSDSPTWHSTIKAPLGVAGPNINDGVESKGSGDYKFIGRTTVENSYIVDSINYSINNSGWKGVGIKDGINDEADEEFEFNFRSDDNNPGYEGYLLDVRVTDSGNRESHRVHFEPFNLTSVQKLPEGTLQLKFNVHKNKLFMKDKLNEYQVLYSNSSNSSSSRKTFISGIPINPKHGCVDPCIYENDDFKASYPLDNSQIVITTKKKFSEPEGKYTFLIIAQSKDNLTQESNTQTLDTTTDVLQTTKTSNPTQTAALGVSTPEITPSFSPLPSPNPSSYTPPQPAKPQGGFNLWQSFINFHLWLFSLLGLPVP